MLYVHGSTDFPDGWIRAAMNGFERAGIKSPSPDILRSYRQRVVNDPQGWAEFSPDPALVGDLLLP